MSETDQQEPLCEIYGDYIVKSLIVKGSLSDVFVVENVNTFDKRVLKRVSLADGNIDKIEKEISIMRALDGCPYTLSLIDAFIQDNYYCIITPYYPTGSIRDIMPFYAGRMIPENTVRCIIGQVLLALQYMHGLGYCHRDIKPENILVANWNEVNPKVILCDFGFATQLTDGEFSKEYCGTLDYVAPEIYFHRPYDNSVDMWSLGVTMHVLLFQCFPLPQFEDDLPSLKHMLCRKTVNLTYFRDYEYFDALNLFLELCSYDTCNRITIEDALQHPWIDIETKLSFPSDSVIQSTLSIISTSDTDIAFT